MGGRSLRNLNPSPLGKGSRSSTTRPYWFLPARWPEYSPSATNLLRDRLSIGHLWPAHLGQDIELAHQPFSENIQVQLPHPRDDGLPGILVDPNPKSGIFFRQSSAARHSSFARRPPTAARSRHRSPVPGKRIDSSTIGSPGSHKCIAGKGELEPTHRGNIARRHSVGIFAPIGVHVNEAPNAFFSDSLGEFSVEELERNVPEYTRM